MDQKVLVLNGDYTAITLCSVQKAFVLLYLDKAEMVAKSEHGTLRTISQSYPKPSIIRLQRYVRVPYKGIALSRHNIFKRDHFECQYCGSTKNLTLDHVVAASRRGLTCSRPVPGATTPRDTARPTKPDSPFGSSPRSPRWPAFSSSRRAPSTRIGTLI